MLYRTFLRKVEWYQLVLISYLPTIRKYFRANGAKCPSVGTTEFLLTRLHANEIITTSAVSGAYTKWWQAIEGIVRNKYLLGRRLTIRLANNQNVHCFHRFLRYLRDFLNRFEGPSQQLYNLVGRKMGIIELLRIVNKPFSNNREALSYLVCPYFQIL